MIKGFVNNFVILSVILLISGCGIIPKKDPDVIITTEPMLTKSEEGEVDMITSAESINLDSVGDEGYTLGNNVIYFDYDKYSVEKKEDKAVIKKYSNYMRKYKNSKVRIEGHADERGSRAYNLALGEKRAENIKEILLINGVSKDSIEVEVWRRKSGSARYKWRYSFIK